MHWKGLRILCPCPSVHSHASALDLLVSSQTYSFLALNKPSKTIHRCSRDRVHTDLEPLFSPSEGVMRKGAHCSAQWGVIPHLYLSGPLWVTVYFLLPHSPLTHFEPDHLYLSVNGPQVWDEGEVMVHDGRFPKYHQLGDLQHRLRISGPSWEWHGNGQ